MASGGRTTKILESLPRPGAPLRKSSNRLPRMAQPGARMALAAAVHHSPPLRGSRSSRAARRWPMRWGANQRVAPRLQHIPTGVGVSLFRVFVGRRSVSFPPTGSRAALAARSDRLGLRGRPTRRAVCPQSQPRTGSCPSHGSELRHGSTAGAEVTDRGEIATDRIAALLELNQGGGDGHGNSPYLPTNTNADIHAITLPLCPTPLALQICRAPGIG